MTIENLKMRIEELLTEMEDQQEFVNQLGLHLEIHSAQIGSESLYFEWDGEKLAPSRAVTYDS